MKKGEKDMTFREFSEMVLYMNRVVLSWNHPMATLIWQQEGYHDDFSIHDWVYAYEQEEDYPILFANLAELAGEL